ncbi:MAG: hypothetical protein EXS23_06580 [Pedosphaera sp.]|nr:hypothetical protein [Pedosphaera sp.]
MGDTAWVVKGSTLNRKAIAAKIVDGKSLISRRKIRESIISYGKMIHFGRVGKLEATNQGQRLVVTKAGMIGSEGSTGV